MCCGDSCLSRDPDAKEPSPEPRAEPGVVNPRSDLDTDPALSGDGEWGREPDLEPDPEPDPEPDAETEPELEPERLREADPAPYRELAATPDPDPEKDLESVLERLPELKAEPSRVAPVAAAAAVGAGPASCLFSATGSLVRSCSLEPLDDRREIDADE